VNARPKKGPWSNGWALAGLLSFVVIGAIYAELERRSGLYWHDVTLPHNYAFKDARTITVDIDQESVALPGNLPATSTALLRLHVDSTWLGRWKEPSIDLADQLTGTISQHLERGAAGKRYLNLGPLLARGTGDPMTVSMRGNEVTWEKQQADLLLFEEPRFGTGPLLIIAPHPDDAEIAAFALYASRPSWIVTVTSGNTPDRRMSGLISSPDAQSRLKGELRAWDSVAIPGLGNVPPERSVNLGYFTLTLGEMYANPAEPVADTLLGTADVTGFRRVTHAKTITRASAENSWRSLVRDLLDTVSSIQPAVIVAPHPALDAARDHRLTTVAFWKRSSNPGSTGPNCCSTPTITLPRSTFHLDPLIRLSRCLRGPKLH
jgi:hypothetical protein